MKDELTTTVAIGRLGEDHAAEYLRSKGYEILGRNVHLGRGELDLVVRKGENLVFAEVKTRHGTKGVYSPYGTPGDAVDLRKREMLIKTAEEYLRQHEEVAECYPRIDVIEVYLDKSHRPSAIEHYENAVHKQSVRKKTKYI